jgi:FkbM family methyltransferase
MLNSGAYEKAISEKMLASLEPGNCVWDVGANIGYYSTRFSETVGASGHVFAFEPSEINRGKLVSAVSGLGNVTVLPIGLSNANGTASFAQGLDEIGATSRIVSGDAAAGMAIVELARGDEIARQGTASPPSVIKIDVEGFELEVLLGLGDLLGAESLRHVFIEVHFGLLDERGMSTAPAEIQALLRSSGFEVVWLDASHIHASR